MEAQPQTTGKLEPHPAGGQAHETVNCPECGLEIGTVIVVEGVRVLNFRGWWMKSISGVCPNCGNPIHWSLADRAFARLMQRYAG